MNVEDFIKEQAELVRCGFGLSQIQSEVWDYVMSNGMGVLRIEAMIFRSMEIYAEIIKQK